MDTNKGKLIKNMKYIYTIIAGILLVACAENNQETTAVTSEKSIAQLKEELLTKGFSVFDYIDGETNDTVLMQQYYIVFLKRGENRNQSAAVADSLQKLHLAHLGRMYEEGYADISGPFGSDGDIKGITIYNVPNLDIADSLSKLDPMVQSGRLTVEVHPWWAAKNFCLR